MVFMATEIQNATNTFDQESPAPINAGASSMPSDASSAGTPAANTVIAMLIPTPSTPQTNARGAIPKPGIE